MLESRFGGKRDVDRTILESGRVVETVRAVEIDDWSSELGRSGLAAQSVNNYLAVAHAFFEYAEKCDYAKSNPESKVEKSKVVDKPAAIFRPDKLQKLLAAAGDDTLPLLVIGAFAGLRLAEIFRWIGAKFRSTAS